MRFLNAIPIIGFLILGSIIIVKIISLKKENVPINSNSNKSGFIRYFLYPVFTLIFLLIIYEMGKAAFQISFSVLPLFFSEILINSVYLKITGTLLILFSILFMKFTFRDFSTSFRFGLNAKNAGEIIKTGVFAVSRNPFFVSIEMFFLGIAVVLPNLFFISLAVLTLISIHLFILKEEKFLLKIYGEEYKAYKKKVRRYF